jgi:hypothetical protein
MMKNSPIDKLKAIEDNVEVPFRIFHFFCKRGPIRSTVPLNFPLVFLNPTLSRYQFSAIDWAEFSQRVPATFPSKFPLLRNCQCPPEISPQFQTSSSTLSIAQVLSHPTGISIVGKSISITKEEEEKVFIEQTYSWKFRQQFVFLLTQFRAKLLGDIEFWHF